MQRAREALAHPAHSGQRTRREHFRSRPRHGEAIGPPPRGPAHARRGSLGQTLKRTLTEFKEDELTDRAAALTYYAILSIFPALIALVSIVGIVGTRRDHRHAHEVVSSVGPSSAVDTFQGPIESLTKSSGTAGIMPIVGIVAALWTASGYVGAFMRAANVIYEVEEGRSFIEAAAAADARSTLVWSLLALVLVALVLTARSPRQSGSAIGIADSRGDALGHRQVARPPPALVVGMIAPLYDSSPNAKLARLQVDRPGRGLRDRGLAGRVGRVRVYVANFGFYDKTYGTLGGVVPSSSGSDHEPGDPLRRRAERRARALPAARIRPRRGPSASCSSTSGPR